MIQKKTRGPAQWAGGLVATLLVVAVAFRMLTGADPQSAAPLPVVASPSVPQTLAPAVPVPEAVVAAPATVPSVTESGEDSEPASFVEVPAVLEGPIFEPNVSELRVAEPSFSPPVAPPVRARTQRGRWQQALFEMPGPERHYLFRLTLNDAGFECDDVESSMPLGDDAAAWRVQCGGMRSYWVGVDDFGMMWAEHAAYGDSRF